MPTSPKILVTGATGKTGGAVVTQLLAKGYPVRVQDARSDLLQRRGAEVVVADIFDLPGINPATYDRRNRSSCCRRRISRSTIPTGRRATVSRPRWWVHSPLKEAFA
jgi:uncharacterized protein YbjT (DUF2867 family)